MTEENRMAEQGIRIQSDAEPDLNLVESNPNTAESTPDTYGFHSLDIRYITVERIVGWIFTCVVYAGIGIGWGISLVASWPPTIWTGSIALGILAVVLVLAWATHSYPKIAHKWCKYRLDEHGLEIHRGWIWRTVVNIPRSRVQHTDVRQGPIQRQYEIGTLVVYTAGTQHASVELAGLSKVEAMRLRSQLISDGQGQDAV